MEIRSRLARLVGLSLGFGAMLSMALAADSTASGKPLAQAKKNSSAAAQTTKQVTHLDAAEVARVERFVDRNLDQLKPLLAYLKKNSMPQYRRAINDLAKASNRIETLRRRDPELAQLDLELLRKQTEIDLVSARLSKTDKPQWQRQLRDALVARQELRVARMQHQVRSLRARIEQLDQQVTKLTEAITESNAGRGEKVAAELQAIVRRAELARRKHKNSETE